MTRAIFPIIIVIIFAVIGGWLLFKKFTNEPTVTITPTLSPELSVSPVVGQKIKLENGLEIEDVRVGTGQEAKAGDTISANYLGTFANGTKFDSSYDRGQPFSFILGSGQVIQGWEIGMLGMKVGGKRKLVVPPQLGYGSQAYGPIPANSTLYFVVELMAVQSPR